MLNTSDSYVPFYLTVFGKSGNGSPDKNVHSEESTLEVSENFSNNDIILSSKENESPRMVNRRAILPTPEINTIISPQTSRNMVPSLLSLDIQRPEGIFQEEAKISNHKLASKNILPSQLLSKCHRPLNKNKNYPKKIHLFGEVNSDSQKLWRVDGRPNNNIISKKLIYTPAKNSNVQNPYTNGISSFFFNNTIQGLPKSCHQQKLKVPRQNCHLKSSINYSNKKNGGEKGVIEKKVISKKCYNNNTKHKNGRKVGANFEVFQKKCNTYNVKHFNNNIDNFIRRPELKHDYIPLSNRKPLLPAPFKNQH
ncbi:Hypothetical protein SRAE_2000051600 [Strongyloides ratti]|uniref:Uncharacterized protein n=1 Tax=Strongyloides ratti TaxID=34506 RepID=A0A090L7R6_STRRB|nr:Hypothetical protein SRAE_2000051600 [Strongyloides ratti]CEF65841.1 Hypothetical protein SRAE_2000051600 [Strongyloides ratti]